MNAAESAVRHQHDDVARLMVANDRLHDRVDVRDVTSLLAAGTKIIDEFIHYVKGFPQVWFARRIEIAEWWLQKGYG